MTTNDIEPTTATPTSGQWFVKLLRAWAAAYVRTYEPLVRSGNTVDASIRLRVVSIA